MGSEEYVRDDILDSEEMRKVYIAGIPSTAQDADLKSLIESLGGTCDLSVVRKEDKKNLFGFATFETSDQVDELLLNRESLKLNGKALDVNRAVPKTNTWHGAHEKTKKLFIANLPRNTTEDELKEYFKARHLTKYGEVESIKLIKKKDENNEKTNDNVGYGFIEVSCEDLADKMAIQHNHFTFGGRNIELKKHVPSADGGGGGRGRGRGRGGNRGGGQFQQQGGYNNGFGGQQWGADSYGASAGYGGYGGGFGGGYGGGYGGGFGGGYGGGGFGYGAAPAASAGGRGRGRGGNRFNPY